MRVCHFEDRNGDFGPLAWTRPVFELLCGRTTLAAKQQRYFAATAVGAVVRPFLAELYRHEHPETAVNDMKWLGSERTVLVNARWLPPASGPILGAEGIGCVGTELAYAVIGPEELQTWSLPTFARDLEDWQSTAPHHHACGKLLAYPWDLIEENPAQLVIDFDHVGLVGNHPSQPVKLVGLEELLFIDPRAEIDPEVVADTRHGPVVIDKHAVIQAFTRLEGPCYVGPHTHVKAAQIHAGTTLGPHCRIGGEVEASIVHGYSNKAHDGFLGHSYLGEWVNFGAGTQTSDLRNDYGKVSVTINGRSLSTGQMKVGSIVGDHTKTGLGTLFNTGSNIGVFCNILPTGALAPNYIPSFTNWWKGSMREGSDFVRLFNTAKEVMRRRGKTLTDRHCAVYQHIWNETAQERRQVFYQMDMRARRQSA